MTKHRNFPSLSCEPSLQLHLSLPKNPSYSKTSQWKTSQQQQKTLKPLIDTFCSIASSTREEALLRCRRSSSSRALFAWRRWCRIDSNEKQPAVKCGRNRCNCFNGNSNESSDDEFDVSSCCGDSVSAPSAADSLDVLKGLKIVEKNKACKRKADLTKIVTDDLLFIGHDASKCKSRWEKSPSYPAGNPLPPLSIVAVEDDDKEEVILERREDAEVGGGEYDSDA